MTLHYTLVYSMYKLHIICKPDIFFSKTFFTHFIKSEEKITSKSDNTDPTPFYFGPRHETIIRAQIGLGMTTDTTQKRRPPPIPKTNIFRGRIWHPMVRF
jgi:hypothetical protein